MRALILVLLISVSLWGCAPPPSSKPVQDPSVALASLGATSISADGQWKCPADVYYNVTTKNSTNYSSAPAYRVCVNRNNTARFQIQGVNSPSTICIYPMNDNNGAIYLANEDAQCFSLGNTAIEVQFQSMGINYMSIVDQNYTYQFESCLSGPACPSHAEGFVQ